MANFVDYGKRSEESQFCLKVMMPWLKLSSSDAIWILETILRQIAHFEQSNPEMLATYELHINKIKEEVTNKIHRSKQLQAAGSKRYFEKKKQGRLLADKQNGRSCVIL